MIVGNGLIARSLSKYKEDTQNVIFASGVSNSNEQNVDRFRQERNLLTKIINENPFKKIIYFSSCAVVDGERNMLPYFRHKIEIENYIKNEVSEYLILRLPIMIGFGGNQYNLINYLVDKVKNDERFILWSRAERHILDVEDFTKIFNEVVSQKNKILNITYPKSYRVSDIISAIENVYSKKAVYEPVDKGSSCKVDTSHIEAVLNKLKIVNPDIEEIIEKYKL